MYLSIARQMYGGDLPTDLEFRLNRINQLSEQAGGALKSRQVIAIIVNQYEVENIGTFDID